MTKHLVDIDEGALIAARAELGTATLNDTVNRALCRIAAPCSSRVATAFDLVAGPLLADRAETWG